MWNTVGKRSGLIIVIGILLLALIAGSCSPQPAVEQEKTVKVGLRAILTGAIASNGVPHGYGVIDHVTWRNKQGGIDSVMIDLSWEDTAGLVPREISAYKRFNRKEVLLQLPISSSGQETTALRQQKDQIPSVYMGPVITRAVTKPVPWVVYSGPGGTPASVSAYLQWFKDNWKETHPPRVGSIIYDFVSGWETLEGTKFVASRLDMEFVGYEVLPLLGAIDTSVEWLRLAGKEPDVLVCFFTGATALTTIKDAARLEIFKQGMVAGTIASGIDRFVIEAAGGDADGWYNIYWTPDPSETGLPGIKAMADAARQNRGWEPQDIANFYSFGWLQAWLAVEGIKLAINKVGWENLTGLAIREGLTNVANIDTGFGFTGTLSDDKIYLAKDRVYHIENGRNVPVSDFIDPIYTYKDMIEGK